MSGEDYNGVGFRSQKRKRKTADKILNISIGIVILLILLVGAQFLIGGNSSEPVVGDELENNENRNDEEIDNNGDDPNVEGQLGQEKEEEVNDTVADTEQENKPTEDSSSEQPNSSEESQTGQWEPIGTVQEEPFAAVYDKEHINWEEMTRAFQYATGLGEDMTLWHVGNGGDHLSAVGVVANYENRTTPYQVRIEWVPNEGWMPVSVIQLEENIYIEKYSSTTEDTSNDSE